MSTTTISALTAASNIDGSADYLPIDNAASLTTQKINRNIFLGVTGQPADISTVQNFTNKTVGNTNTVTLKDTLFTLQDDGDITKQARFQLSGITTSTTRTYTLPNVSDTLVTLGATQTLTGKTLTSPTISGGTIDNTTITVDAIGEHTAANGVTIDGLNIKDGKLNTNNSVITASITDGSVTPAKLQSGAGSSWTWQSWTPVWTNLTSGNGVTVADYVQIGKTVYFRLRIVLGTTSSVGSNPVFTLPVTANSDYFSGSQEYPIGFGRAIDAGTAGYPLTLRVFSVTQGVWGVGDASGTYAKEAAISATIPFTFGAADILMAEGFYEAA